MQKSILRKGLVVGIILLFVGTSMVPSIIGGIGEENGINDLQDLVFSLGTRIPLDIHRNQDARMDYENIILNGEIDFSSFNEPEWRWAVKGGGASDDRALGICMDSDGSIYITGYFYGTAVFGSTTLTSNNSDVFVAKLAPGGDWQWAIQTETVQDARAIGVGICVDSMGNAYISGLLFGTASFGSTIITSNGLIDVFIAKLTINGDWLWAVNAGGDSIDVSSSLDICIDVNENIYVTGFFEGSAMFGSTTLLSQGSYDIFIAKLNTDGGWQWAKSAGGKDYDVGSDICVDLCGNIYVTGYFTESAEFGPTVHTSTGLLDVFVAKLDTNGNWLWARKAGGIDSDSGYGVAVDDSGNVYITGIFQGMAAMFGNTTLVSQGSADVFVAKLDTNGVWQWAKSAGGTASDIGYGVAVDTSGNAIITGYFQESTSFGNITLTSAGDNDVFVAKLSEGGSGLTFNITGGLGVNLKITNSGTTRATVTDWHIQVEGGIFGKINEMINGTVDISAGETKTVGTGLFFGIGSISIVAKVADEEKTTAGTHLFIFSIVK